MGGEKEIEGLANGRASDSEAEIEEARTNRADEIKKLRAALAKVDPFEMPICGGQGGPTLLMLIRLSEEGGPPPSHRAKCQAAYQQLVSAEPSKEQWETFHKMLNDVLGPPDKA